MRHSDGQLYQLVAAKVPEYRDPGIRRYCDSLEFQSQRSSWSCLFYYNLHRHLPLGKEYRSGENFREIADVRVHVARLCPVRHPDLAGDPDRLIRQLDFLRHKQFHGNDQCKQRSSCQQKISYRIVAHIFHDAGFGM